MPTVLVPAARWVRWTDNFAAGHGHTGLAVTDGALRGVAEDGSHFAAHLPFAMPYDGPAESGAFADAAVAPGTWGVLLVRKGGFAVARLVGAELAEHKIVADMRPPDILRFGLSPLTTRFVDVWDGLSIVADLIR